jgi:putative DNA primase/helicase
MVGQIQRILDVPADAGKGFGVYENLHGFAGGAELSDALKENASQYYGSAGAAFVEALIGYRGKWSELGLRLKEATDRLLSSCQLKGAQGQILRAAGHFGVIALAGELATKLGVTGWASGEAERAVTVCFKAWLSKRGRGRALEDELIKAQIRRFVQEQDACFPEITRKRKSTTESSSDTEREELEHEDIEPAETEGELQDNESKFIMKDGNRLVLRKAGYSKISPDGKYWLVFPGFFRKELCKGFTVEKVEQVLFAAGWLKRDKAGKTCPRLYIPGGNQRMYLLTPKVLTGE